MTIPVARSDAPRRTVRIAPEAIPRLPVFGWASYLAERGAKIPCLLDSAPLHFTTSGRAAIAIALKSLGVGAGDRVLLPTYHCPTMVAPAVHAGATPVFYPVQSGGVDLQFLERVDLAGVRALLVAHYFGMPQPMAALREFCDRKRIALIEDCAHALFGVSDGSPVASWGDYAVTSFTKFFPVPEGGCVIVNRGAPRLPALARRTVRDELKAAVDILEVGTRYGRIGGFNALLGAVFRLKGRDPSAARAFEAEIDAGEDNVDEFDSAHAWSRLTFASRFVVRSVSRSRVVERRRANYRTLAGRLGDLKEARVLWPVLPETAVPYVFPLWLEQPDGPYYALKEAGVPVFRWDRLWPGVPFIPGDEGVAWSRHILQLPCHQDLRDRDVEWLVTQVRRVLGVAGG